MIFYAYRIRPVGPVEHQEPPQMKVTGQLPSRGSSKSSIAGGSRSKEIPFSIRHWRERPNSVLPSPERFEYPEISHVMDTLKKSLDQLQTFSKGERRRAKIAARIPLSKESSPILSRKTSNETFRNIGKDEASNRPDSSSGR